MHRQQLVYSAGPSGMEPLADDETLGGAGVVQDGTAELDVLLAELTAAELAELAPKVWCSTNASLLGAMLKLRNTFAHLHIYYGSAFTMVLTSTRFLSQFANNSC